MIIIPQLKINKHHGYQHFFLLILALLSSSPLLSSSRNRHQVRIHPSSQLEECYSSTLADGFLFRAIKAESAKDLQLFLHLFKNDPEATSMLFLPQSFHLESLEIFLTDIFPSSCFNPKDHNYAYFIYQKEQLIGYTEIHALPSLETPNVSIFIIKSLRRQGLATKAILELKHHLETSLGRSICPHICCRKDNLSIQALLKKHDYVITQTFKIDMLQATDTEPLQLGKVTILSFISGRIQRNYEAIRRAIEQDSSSSDEEDYTNTPTRQTSNPDHACSSCTVL